MDITEKVEESCGSSVVVLMFSLKLRLKVFLPVYDVICFLLYIALTLAMGVVFYQVCQTFSGN